MVAKKKQGVSWGRRGPRLTVYAASPNLTSVDTGSGASFKGNVVAGDLEFLHAGNLRAYLTF